MQKNNDQEEVTNPKAIGKTGPSSSSTSATNTAQKPQDDQVPKLLNIINKSNAEAAKLDTNVQEMEVWKAGVEDKLNALTGAMEAVSHELTATANAQTMLEQTVKAQGDTITAALFTMQTQIQQLLNKKSDKMDDTDNGEL